MVNPLSHFSFQPVLHDWCNKGRGMCYHVCAMVHIKEPLLLIGKSSPCGGSGFRLSLSEWSFTISLTPYKMCSFLPYPACCASPAFQMNKLFFGTLLLGLLLPLLYWLVVMDSSGVTYMYLSLDASSRESQLSKLICIV